jgi:MYXO-CTERM domain-containing protein
MPIALSKPSWKQLAIPLFVTFGFPLFAPVVMVASAWAMPGSFPYAAGLALLSPLMAYVYFPLATASRGFFNKSNALKSVLLGLVAFEIYRQLLVSVFKVSGASVGAVIQQHCGRDVEAFQAAIGCGAAVVATQTGTNLLLWLLPAAALFSFSRRRNQSPQVHSEA